MRVLLLLVFVFLEVVAAKEERTAPLYHSSKIVGMGNANISFVDDQDAIFYNPANLDVLEKNFHLSLAQAAITLDDNLVSFASLIFANTGNFEKFATEIEKVNTEFANSMVKYDQKFMNVQAQTDLSFTIGQVGFGVWSKALVSAYYDDGIFIPNPVMKNEFEMAAQLSFGFRLLKQLSLGISPKYWIRVTDTASVNLMKDEFSFDDMDDEDNAVVSTNRFNRIADGDDSPFDYDHLSFDLGLTYHLSNFRASVVFRDIYETTIGYNLSEEEIRMMCDFGLGYRVVYLEDMLNIKGMLFTAEVKDAFNDKSFFTKLNLGGELNLFPFILRGGVTSGYFTYGATLQFIGVRFDFSSYATEGGELPGIEEIRSYIFNIRLGI